MKTIKSAAGVLACGLIFAAQFAFAQQRSTEVRRAEPVDDNAIPRALPVNTPTPSPSPRKPAPAQTQAPQRAPAPPPPAPTATARPAPVATATPHPPPPKEDEDQPRPAPESSSEGESADQRQLDFANGLFSRKMYDLAVPEYEKYLGQFSGSPGRGAAFFYLAQCYRSLGKTPAARTAFQGVLDEAPESDFVGPAAYGIGEILFNQKDYAGALGMFHRSAGKTKEAGLALSARYFEARCLENLGRKDEAANAYLAVVDAKNPNPYREDARFAGGTLLLGQGRKADALKQYEALANETGKAALKAEVTVRAGLVAADLSLGEKGKPDKAMLDRAIGLLQKGRNLPEAGKWRGIAQAGLLRALYSAGQYQQLLTEYKRAQDDVPEEVRPELMLLAANSERQLNHPDAAETIYAQLVAKYPSRDEAKDARYQRLINIYNSHPDQLVAAVDEFLASNPTAERGDQARLLKAEAFYKAGNFQDAAPIYEQLRSSQLSPKLRAESAYKLAWCYVQLKLPQRIIDAFTYFLKAFPDDPQAPPALTRRALAYEEVKDYDSAIADLNTLITKYPNAKEREAAMQQKALLFGQKDDAAGMSNAFQQLLKEYPKTAVAAQAHYYIGKAAFEAKDYKAAIPALEAARKLNKEQYYTPASVRIISAYFYQKNRAALTKEVDAFLAAAPDAKIPGEILNWLGIEYYNEKNYAAAEKYLGALSTGETANVSSDFWFYLADAQNKQGHFAAAEESYQRYLQTTNDPAAKVKTLLALGATKISEHKADDAQKIAEELMRSQPEGKVNADARLLSGDVQVERGQFEDAAKTFMSVALLYDDPAITPRALKKAALAYDKAGKQAEAARATQQLREKYPEFASG